MEDCFASEEEDNSEIFTLRGYYRKSKGKKKTKKSQSKKEQTTSQRNVYEAKKVPEGSSIFGLVMPWKQDHVADPK